MQSKLYSFNEAPSSIKTTVDCSFIIHDFELSENGQIITREVCEANMQSLVNKPVLVDYYYYGDNQTDHFGDHAVYVTTNRDTGDKMVATKTVPIGVFTSVEIGDINGKEYLIGHAILWTDRYYNACSLLYETVNKGVEVLSSCEYLFTNYRMMNNVQHILDPLTYDGHTILNSEQRGNQGIVLPAYEDSRFISFNQAIMTDLGLNNSNTNKEEEGETTMENKFLKAFNEASFGDIRDGIYESLRGVMSVDEYYSLWISSYCTYKDYFIYETAEDGKEVLYKCSYNEVEGKVEVDYENKTKVVREEVWVEVSEVETSLNTIKEELQGTIDTLTVSLNEAQEKVITLEETVIAEKEDKITLSKTIASLNTTVEELQPFKTTVEEMEYNAKLSEVGDMYKEKFTALNASEQYETEEVQSLIKDVLDTEKSLNAKNELSDIILGLISAETTGIVFKELNSKKVENLIPSKVKFGDCGFNF